MFLELKNTTIGYKTPLIKGVEASLKLGDICLLIGNNGVGKTTLIKTILHQIPSLSGEIFIDKTEITSLTNKEIAQKISIVFSKTVLPLHFTVLDLISLGKYIHYPYYFNIKNEDITEIENIIQAMQLQEHKNTLLQNLSDGNLQKAFIGRALAQNAPMIILDEPTTHLDEKNKLMILKLIRSIAKSENKLILFSSHDWRLAKEFADKIWFIQNEKLDSGFTEDVLLKHEELFAPQIFNINKIFKSPKIIAPKIHSEMLFSFLQKNSKKNLENFIFTFHETFWELHDVKIQRKFIFFEEIIDII